MARFSLKAAVIVVRARQTLKGWPASVMVSAEPGLPRIRTASGLIADSVLGSGGVSIWEAIVAAAQSLGNKLIDSRDVAAIQSALLADSDWEKLVVSRAHSAAWINAGASSSGEGITLWQVLADEQDYMPEKKKRVTEEVAKRVARAERRNSPGGAIHPTGIAACMAAAAKLNGY